MKRLALIILIGLLLVGDDGLAQSPAAGGGKTYKKTGDYPVKSTDLGNTLLFICPTACTATMPQNTSSWPKTKSVTIVNGGTTALTVLATPSSTFSGMVPATSTTIQLPTLGNYAVITADSSSNAFIAFGLAGSGTVPTVTFLTGGGIQLTGGGVNLTQ